MPIVSYHLTPSEHVKRWCANCGAVHDHEVATLELGGVRIDGTGNENVIGFPACSCGASEGVFRNWDAAPAGIANSPFDRHRRCVNALAKRLIELGQVHASCVAAVAAEEVDPPDMLELTDGLVL